VEEDFTIHVQPVMQWIYEMVTDPTISHLNKWYPMKKFVVRNGRKEAFRDDLDCGDKWWDIQVSF